MLKRLTSLLSIVGGLRKFQERLHIALPAVLLLTAAGVRVADPEAVSQARSWVFDSYNRLKPRVYENAPVRILDIDDESLAKLGQWPWPRTMVAQVIRQLTKQGAATVGLDIVFAEPDRTSPKQMLPLWSAAPDSALLNRILVKFPDHDDVLAKAISGSNVVVGSALLGTANGILPTIKASFAVAGDSPLPFLYSFKGAVVNLPILEKSAKGSGSFNTIPERDGIIRRVPLLFRVGDAIIPSLAAEALRVVQGASSISIKSSGASGERSFGAKTGISKIKIGGLVVPTDAHGRVWLYFTKTAPQRTIPIWKIFERDFNPATLSGCIVFLGTSAAGLMDQRHTPLNPLAPGVEIHAQVAEQILLKKFLLRPDWADGAELAFLLLFGTLLILLMSRLGAAGGAALALLAAGSACGFSWFAFTRESILVDPLYPAAVVLLIYFASSLIGFLRTEREKAEVRGAFGRYMSPLLVEKLAEHPEMLKLGGEQKRMTFHFCDIAGFTAMSQWREPRELTLLLNRFLTPMTDIILSRNGSIDKYVGDCIVAYWHAPLDDPNHAQNACLAVLEMHSKLKGLNEQWSAETQQSGKEFIPIRIRTGLNTGSCIVGNMGSNQRFDYSVLGDDVNLASRLEGANKFFGTYIMVSESTVKEAGEAVVARELGRVKVVGKEDPVRVYELLAKKGELSPAWREALPIYEKALADFSKRDFSAALEGFEKVLTLIPKDGPSALYKQVGSDYAVLPPPDDWTGVFELTSK